ncbi:SCP2 domain-containing protein [Pseudomonas sp. gcc21]|uniref:ubiquinone anaerobic biosynthesis accessory factor UbiT n=1 Tax=Pseudomonas sp. gcc21 TaxID=2726989 RepID=UPI00145136B3|nr:SCP2 sterol-binding domain-containing protein [Pseudomonas sp. gcc21]QJD58263.1 SCP2 domain-containing protein [Pseudomonas sp. gcc21]
MLNLASLALRAGDPILPLSRHLPFALQRLVIEKTMARIFAEPVADGDFDCLRGRWLRLEVTDLGLAWNVTRTDKGLRLDRTAPSDLCIRGNWREFLLLASRQEDPDTLFFRRRLIIEGDTELGLEIKNLMDSLDPDRLPPRLWQLIQWLGAGATGIDPHQGVQQPSA